MFISKKIIDRRTILRGIGTALALPLLDSMVPPLTAFSKTAANSAKRFGAVYVPNGIMMDNWTPVGEGSAFEFSSTLKPLEPFRQRMLVLSGLNSIPQERPSTEPAGVHSRASTRFLSDIQPKPTLGSDLEAGISMDQLAAREFGKFTQLASLELAMEATDSAGAGDPGFSRVYDCTISWRSPTTPMPMENNPRAVFERLFGDAGSTDPVARMRRMEQERSILDSVTETVATLKARLGAGDSAKLTEYFDAIRDIERRIQKAEEQNMREFPVMDHPAGIPTEYTAHARLMYELFLMAYQCDMTRVITFMMGHEFSGQTYPEVSVPDAHHAISHHQRDPDKLAKLARINKYHVTLFAEFLQKMQSTQDGDGSLLDHSAIIYGAGMSDGNAHDPHNLPILLLGGGSGTIQGGRHLTFKKDTPLANLHVTLLDKLGVPVGRLGDSNGEFPQLSAV